jgi:hypothetical protein
VNWYRFIKIAQIWNLTESDVFINQFESDLQDLYKLEYMWSMINQRPFNGLEQRRQNISNNLRDNLNVVADEVKSALSGVFYKWLSSHALLEPATWARSRVDELTEWHSVGDVFDSMLGEYMNYSVGNEDKRRMQMHSPRNYASLQNKSIREMLNFASMNMDKMPYFQQSFEEALEGHREMLRDDLISEGFEDFSERWGNEFQSEDEAAAYIKNISIDDVDLDSLYYFEGASEMSEFVSNSVDPVEILIEFYEHCVFPLWYRHWKEEGIDETRATIEQINSRLESASAENTQEFMIAVNLALNAAHQTGAMTDYIENDTGASNIESLLNDLSSGSEVPIWDQQLRAVGVQL